MLYLTFIYYKTQKQCENVWYLRKMLYLCTHKSKEK